MKNALIYIIPSCLALTLSAQDSSLVSPEGDGKERVQYVLVMPEEKTPELVRQEENSPFEARNDEEKQEGDTEENRVRDILVGLPAVGGGAGPQGMRVMLGSMRLEAGQDVPNVLPDQQVKLKVKSVTPTAIELVWIEKKPSGLPPKPFVIPVDVSPRVRYRLPSGAGDSRSSGIGTMSREGFSAFTPRTQDPEAPAIAVKALPVDDQPVAQKAAPVSKEATQTPSPAPSNVHEASVLQMLFGKHAAQPK
jgi:hypothetical protein